MKHFFKRPLSGKMLVMASFLILSNYSIAQVSHSGTIKSMGCHHVDGTCYFSMTGLDKTPTCNKIAELRFDASTTNGKRTYASLFAAYMIKKRVVVNIPADFCHTGYSSFNYYSIYDDDATAPALGSNCPVAWKDVKGDDGSCKLPEGPFKTKDGSLLFSNGKGQFCGYSSMAKFQASFGKTDPASLPLISNAASWYSNTMKYDGACL